MPFSEVQKQNRIPEAKRTAYVRRRESIAATVAGMVNRGVTRVRTEYAAGRVALKTTKMLAAGGLTVAVEAASPLIRLPRRKVEVIDNSAPAFPNGIEEDPREKAINATTIHRDGSRTTVREDGSSTIYNKLGYAILDIGSDGSFTSYDRDRKGRVISITGSEGVTTNYDRKGNVR